MKLLISVALLVAAFLPSALAQSTSPMNWSAGAGYNYIHSNAPPAACGCFSLKGGTAFLQRQVTPTFGLQAAFTGAYNPDVDASHKTLTLLTFLAGVQYRGRPRARVGPFGQILVGASHAEGTLYNPGTPSTAFAARFGGGLDLKLSTHLSLRLLDAEYLLTLLPNGRNARQNNLSLGTGINFRFGKK